MKIGFDAQLLMTDNKTGIAWCADHLVREFAAAPEYECVLNVFARGDAEDVLAEYAACGASINISDSWIGKIYKPLWAFFPLPYRWFFGSSPKITQFFSFVVPPGVKGKCVTVIYDMAYCACPETVKRVTRNWLRLTMPRSVRRADAIVTISEFSKREIMQYLNVPAEKITVMPCGVDTSVYRPDYDFLAVEACKQKYRISGEYFLYFGTLEPRKNLVKLIEAYAVLAGREAPSSSARILPKLVLAGGKGWYYESIFERVKELGLEKQIVFTGYVDAADAAPLMCGAKIFVFPSLYEGFGIPPLEAMACGTPVIVSDCASLPEVVGDAGILVSPDSAENIADAMERIWQDDSLGKELSRRGLVRAAQFTWKRSADILKGVYGKVTV